MARRIDVPPLSGQVAGVPILSQFLGGSLRRKNLLESGTYRAYACEHDDVTDLESDSGSDESGSDSDDSDGDSE